MLKFIALSLLLITSSKAFACEKATLVSEGKKIELCFDKVKETYLSKNCSDVGKCFFDRNIVLTLKEDQSPGFTLCYELKGTPFFGVIEGKKEKVPMCKKGAFFADHEKIFYHYKGLKK